MQFAKPVYPEKTVLKEPRTKEPIEFLQSIGRLNQLAILEICEWAIRHGYISKGNLDLTDTYLEGLRMQIVRYMKEYNKNG